MEIIGPLIIPVLIETGKQLWQLYIKKIGEKAAGKLADLTVNRVSKVAQSIWSGEETTITVADYEAALRKAASYRRTVA